MSHRACTAALRGAGRDADDLALVLGFSGMPDYQYPKDVNRLAGLLGARRAACWTIDTACASFITALRIGSVMAETGALQQGRRRDEGAGLCLITMTMSWVHRGIDRTATDYASLGDGAAAILFETANAPTLLGAVERTDPDGFDFVTLESAYAARDRSSVQSDAALPAFAFSTDPTYRTYFRETALDPARELITAHGLPDWFIAHQARPSLLDAWCDALGIPRERCLHTFDVAGNMSAVNIPYTMHSFFRDESGASSSSRRAITRGDRVLLFAPGAGMHLAAAYLLIG